MKTIFSLFVGTMLLVGSLYAAPFLGSDPYELTENQPDEFVIMQPGKAAIVIPAFVLPDGRRMLKYDLAGTPVGRFKGEIKAVSALWGDSAIVPFDVPIGIGAPTNLKLSLTGSP